MIYTSPNNIERILRVPISSNFFIFMRLPVFLVSNEFCIVIINPKKFLKVWNSDYASGNPEIWKKDYKYNKSASCFANSSYFPIYPSDISDCINGKFTFIDGTTRTLWLLANHALFFPFICTARTKFILDELAGLQISYKILQYYLL